jgi:hypothetical protein
MISDRAWYLAAAGVLALGLSHSVLNSGADWVSQISDRTLARVEQASMGATCGGRTQILLGRDPVNVSALQIRVAQVQARLACRRAAIARHRVERVRLQTERTRMMFEEQ